jgi:hypothetical protein
MSRAPSPALPDLDDTEFAAKLRPLGDAVIPKSRQPDKRIFEYPDIQSSGYADSRKDEGSKSRLSVAEHLERIEKARGPKRRFEYLIPVRVGDALAADAASRGQSAATRLLEVLRDAGYPVIPEDFIDLRKEKGR